MYVDTSSVNSVDSYYTSNSAVYGGTFYIRDTFLQTSHNYYTNNTADNGGVIDGKCLGPQSHAGSIASIGNYYLGNAAQDGGAIRTDVYIINATDDTHFNNYAEAGRAIYHQQGIIYTSGTNFAENRAAQGGAVDTCHSSPSFSDTHFI